MKPTLPATIIAAGAALAVFNHQANAQTTIFSDNFSRSDSWNIQESMNGITDNTGSSLSAGSVYSQPWIDPANAAPNYQPPDTDASNGGGEQILSGQLQMAVGPGSANLYVNHNFINSSILAAGGFTVSLDLADMSGTTTSQGGLFAIGMTAAEAASAGQAASGPNAMSGAFLGNIGNTIPTGSGSVVVISDFWLALRGNSTLVWGSSSGTINGVHVDSNSGTISATFNVSDFNAGSTVDYSIAYDDTVEGTGSFTWSDTDANYVGVDARDGSYVNFTGLDITTAPEPSAFAILAAGLGAVGLFVYRRKAKKTAC